MLELGKGYQVAAGQDLVEGYEQTSETYLTANVGVNKLVEVCQHFIVLSPFTLSPYFLSWSCR